MRDAISVIGIGNVLLGDDGAGVWVARHVARAYRFAPHVEVLDGGTLGLDLITYVADADRLIVVDAASTGGEPGAIAIVRGAAVPAVMRQLLSAHEAALCDLLAALTLLGKMPREFIAIGIEPLRIHPSLELSAPVRGALARAEAAVVAELRAWGVRCDRREARREPSLML
jgi:hydrogenase maturation protease